MLSEWIHEPAAVSPFLHHHHHTPSTSRVSPTKHQLTRWRLRLQLTPSSHHAAATQLHLSIRLRRASSLERQTQGELFPREGVSDLWSVSALPVLKVCHLLCSGVEVQSHHQQLTVSPHLLFLVDFLETTVPSSLTSAASTMLPLK